MAGFTQKEIAKTLGLAEKTVSLWKQEGNWEAERARAQLFGDTIVERMQKIVSHNLRILTDRAKDNPDQLIEKGEFDALAKAMSSIKRNELAWVDLVKILRGFVKWLAHEDGQKAQAIEALVNKYLNEQRRSYAD